MAFVLTAAGALLACGLEMLEALAIVLAVGVTRRWRDALLGALGAVGALAAVAGLVGPVLLASLPLDLLRVVVGTALLLFGLEWLRKGILRLAGRRSPSDSFREFLEEREALEEVALPPAGRADWAGRANSCSILEAFDRLAELTGKKMAYEYLDQHRAGDHICYISNLGKVQSHYPDWRILRSLDDIFEEILRGWELRNADGHEHRTGDAYSSCHRRG